MNKTLTSIVRTATAAGVLWLIGCSSNKPAPEPQRLAATAKPAPCSVNAAVQREHPGKKVTAHKYKTQNEMVGGLNPGCYNLVESEEPKGTLFYSARTGEFAGIFGPTTNPDRYPRGAYTFEPGDGKNIRVYANSSPDSFLFSEEHEGGRVRRSFSDHTRPVAVKLRNSEIPVSGNEASNVRYANSRNGGYISPYTRDGTYVITLSEVLESDRATGERVVGKTVLVLNVENGCQRTTLTAPCTMRVEER